jgi:hypothetical protein
MGRTEIKTQIEYDRFITTGCEPLIDSGFDIDINLRVEIQKKMFGGNPELPEVRNKFFRWVWDRKVHVCEETKAFLGHDMKAEFMSHILSRGAHIEMAFDPRNINILSPDAHREWESGKREKMYIFAKNKDLVALLKADYAELKNYNTFPEEKSKEAEGFVPGIDEEWIYEILDKTNAFAKQLIEEHFKRHK